MSERTQLGRSLAVSVSQATVPSLAEGLLHMRVGSRLRLFCPPRRDFSHPKVSIRSTLVYDIGLQILSREGEGERK